MSIRSITKCHQQRHSLHCIPLESAPSAPPIIRSDCKNNPGPIVFAVHGTRGMRLLKLVIAFCSIVIGWSFIPLRYGCFFHSSSVSNSAPIIGSQKAIWHIRPIPYTVTSLAPSFFRAAILIWVCRKIIFCCKISLFFWNCKFT